MTSHAVDIAIETPARFDPVQILVRLVLDPTTARLLRWPMPETIEEITIGEGRAVVRPAS